MAESAFAVIVPDAEPYVGRLRARHDPSAALGAEAHITILYPFMSPELLDAQVMAQVRDALSMAVPFVFRLASIRRFPGVLYLAPEDDASLVALTRLLVARFPEFPPYGGKHTGIVPHLTVAQTTEDQLDVVEAELRTIFPAAGIASRCDELALMENASGRWRRMDTIALRASGGTRGA
jgi:2'-5' RNA ligase